MYRLLISQEQEKFCIIDQEGLVIKEADFCDKDNSSLFCYLLDHETFKKFYKEVLAEGVDELFTEALFKEWNIDYSVGDYRICGVCNHVMSEGYVVEDCGYEYYCSDACLRVVYTKKYWNMLYDSGFGYWTTWY